jgi:hypothetical protein
MPSCVTHQEPYCDPIPAEGSFCINGSTCGPIFPNPCISALSCTCAYNHWSCSQWDCPSPDNDAALDAGPDAPPLDARDAQSDAPRVDADDTWSHDAQTDAAMQ